MTDHPEIIIPGEQITYVTQYRYGGRLHIGIHMNFQQEHPDINERFDPIVVPYTLIKDILRESDIIVQRKRTRLHIKEIIFREKG